MRYFRVFTSYTDFISIEETELEKALFAFIKGQPVVFEKGATSRIESIVPDYHRAMGWNPAHRMGTDDWNEIESSKVGKEYVGVIGEYKEKIGFLIHSGQEDLIGKNIPMKDLGISKISFSESKELSDKMKI